MTAFTAILVGFFMYFFVKYRVAIWMAIRSAFYRRPPEPKQKAIRENSVKFFKLEDVWPEDEERKAS